MSAAQWAIDIALVVALLVIMWRLLDGGPPRGHA